MGERKVLNKYIPPDFDPSKIPKGKGLKGGQMKVRMMLPMSVCCNTCGNYIVKGTKFNSRKEDVVGEDYLGITIFRFYFRCTRCSAEIAMKTDPKNSDYIVETGASRNFEPWREKDAAKAEAEEEREAEEEGNSMKALENRTLESKREMDIMAALDEMRSLNQRHAKISSADAIAAIHGQIEAERLAVEQAEEAQARRIFEEAQKQSVGFVRRLESDSDSGEEGPDARGGGGGKKRKVEAPTNVLAGGGGGPAGLPSSAPTLAVKPKPKPAAFVIKAKPKAAAAPPKKEESDNDSAGGLGLLGDYGSDSGS